MPSPPYTLTPNPSPRGRGEIQEERAMNDWQQDTLEDYQRKGFANRSGYGQHPVLLIVDFIYGFTDPASPLALGLD